MAATVINLTRKDLEQALACVRKRRNSLTAGLPRKYVALSASQEAEVRSLEILELKLERTIRLLR